MLLEIFKRTCSVFIIAVGLIFLLKLGMNEPLEFENMKITLFAAFLTSFLLSYHKVKSSKKYD